MTFHRRHHQNPSAAAEVADPALRPPRMSIPTMVILAGIVFAGCGAWFHAEDAIKAQAKEIDDNRVATEKRFEQLETTMAANRAARDHRMDLEDTDLKLLLGASAAAQAELKEIERRLDARP